jgi:hypothetical protein
MVMVLGTTPGDENSSNFTAHCPLPTIHIYTINVIENSGKDGIPV